jgi:hypothetical protein
MLNEYSCLWDIDVNSLNRCNMGRTEPSLSNKDRAAKGLFENDSLLTFLVMAIPFIMA